MFTGLIEAIGILKNKRQIAAGMSFNIECEFGSGSYISGESISVDGICVTVEEFDTRGFTFSASGETVQRSTIGRKIIGGKVHLERALRVGDRLGGHLVQGHVDGIGKVERFLRKETDADLRIKIPDHLSKYIVEKGSLAVQGVSLTVASFAYGKVTIALIPSTLKATYFGDMRPGEDVNLEVDVIAKYVESMLPGDGRLDEDKLKRWGFG
jgi:riboflavin synthase